MNIPDPNNQARSPIARFERVRIDCFNFAGLWNCASACALEMLPQPDGRVVVIASELRDNPGTSVTNGAELLATQVCQRFCIAPERLVWIEHYGYACDYSIPRDYDLVTFQPPTQPLGPRAASAALGSRMAMERGEGALEKVFAYPTWRRMLPEDWQGLGLPSRPAVDYELEG